MAHAWLMLIRRLAPFQSLEKTPEPGHALVVKKADDNPAAANATKFAEQGQAFSGDDQMVQQAVAENAIDHIVLQRKAGGIALP